MLQGLYCIRDRVAMQFGPPQLLRNDAVAIRWFQTVIANTQKQAPVQASDYELYLLGFFDEDKGKILPITPGFDDHQQIFAAQPKGEYVEDGCVVEREEE